MSVISLENEINALRSGNREVIIKNNSYLRNIFDTYYVKADKNEFAAVMNRLIEICVSCGDSELEDDIMDTLELGGYRDGMQNVDFEPLVKMFENEKYSDRLWHLVIILGGSLQRGYIDFLNSIETDDEFLKKEISDAVYGLEHSKYDGL